MYRNLLIVSVFVLISLAATTAPAQAAGSSPLGSSAPIIATGAQREYIRSLPIEQRPNRPLHFYGNTVRRMNQRSR
jgi:hypothetical protein